MQNGAKRGTSGEAGKAHMAQVEGSSNATKVPQQECRGDREEGSRLGDSMAHTFDGTVTVRMHNAEQPGGERVE